MLDGSSHGIIKPKNARSTQNIAVLSKEAPVSEFSKTSMVHHFPRRVITTKGALDTVKARTQRGQTPTSVVPDKGPFQRCRPKNSFTVYVKAGSKISFSKSQILGTKHCFLLNPQLEAWPVQCEDELRKLPRPVPGS